MQPPPRPENETARLGALARYELLDTFPEHSLDDLTALAAHICGAPISLISLVDDNRQWFKSRHGEFLSQTPRAISFCGHALLQTDVFTVPDATLDQRFRDNPLVTEPPGIRFYAGAPLVTPDGYALGTLCVLDHVARALTATQEDALRILSRQVMAHFELRRRTQELVASEMRLIEVFDHCPVGVAINRSSDRRFVDVNDAFANLLGWSRDEMIGRTGVELNMIDAEAAAGLRSRLGTPGTIKNFETPIRTKSGEIREILMGTVRVNLRGEPHVVTTFVDISDRKRSEARIEHLNRVYAVLSEINQAIVREQSADALLANACRIAVEKGGFLLAWIGMVDDSSNRLAIRAHAGADDATLTILNRLILRDPPAGCSFTRHALTGTSRGLCNDIAADPAAAEWRDAALARGYRAMASFPLMIAGRVVGTFNLYASEAGFFDEDELTLLDELAADVSFAIDVHQRERSRQRAETDLRTSEERFREVVENIREVFWVNSPAKNEILYVSPAYESVWGRTCASLYAAPRSWMDNIHPQDRPRIARAAETKLVRGDYDEVYRIVRPDGEVRWIRDRAFPIRDAGGAVHRVAGTAEDITAQRHLEDQFRQSQKMEAVGQLAGGVAHDFNNILAAMLMQIDLADQVAGLPLAAERHLQDIKAAAERAANLTRQLLTFSRRQVMQSRLLDVNEIVTGLTKMLQRILGADIRLQLDLLAGPLVTRADAGMLDQVLMNLVVNARDAMPRGGTLRIETAYGQMTETEPSPPDAPRYVRVRVVDTGSGIAPEHLTHIFEPFFTTKESGKGTGLGLATAFGIVEQHGGAIRVSSDVNRGSTFDVFLPAADATELSAAQERPGPEPQGGTETILVVEDEPAVRRLTRTILERQGYHVLEAMHGVEALQIWDAHASRIDLLLTDIVMPEGIDGRELARRLRARDPRLRVIFTSGYSPEIAGLDLTLPVGQRFLQKPSTPRALVSAVRECLDA